MPKLRKVEKKVEEPKKEEVKKTRVRVPKAKKYEDLPEIPDYERPELEIYEESEFDASKRDKSVESLAKPADRAVESKSEPEIERDRNGLPKVDFLIVIPFLFFTKTK